MATGMVLSAADSLFAALQNRELRELCSSFGYETRLEELCRIVISIKGVLLDAESKHQELSQIANEEDIDWVDKLKDAVYDADDLFDEFTTIAQQLKGMPGGKISRKVQRYLSPKNQLVSAFSMSREIKKLREMLDDVNKDRMQSGCSDVYKPVNRKEGICSFVYEKSIIGREADKEAIVGMLLSGSYSSVEIDQENVSFVIIVGIGGLGKTALTQLVFDDDRIKEAFDWKQWVNMSGEFALKEFLGEQKIFRSYVERRRYLIILDDVRSHDREEWAELREFLRFDRKGSRVLVTSRSMEVADAIGGNLIYKLEGLSEENSWDLFKRIAFKQGKERVDSDLVDIGKDISKKCDNVPLSIWLIGSLLYGQDKNKWLWLRSTVLGKMRQDDESGMMSALMFSYNILTPELKSCFSFCSLFPKDYAMEKDVVVNMWLAQGYLVPNHEGQSMENVGEEYLSILLHRRFFHDIEQDEFGDVHSFKMHDLIHDLALEVAGKDSLMLTSNVNHLGGTICHISTTSTAYSNNLFSPSYSSSFTLRSFLQVYGLKNETSGGVDAIISIGRHLRVLDLHGLAIETLPNTLGKLLHLRYLNLSGNENIEMLPTTITKLHNLHILKLCNCKKLKQLPDDISKLVNLRILDLDKCYGLTHMPARMHNLKFLHTLTKFVVGGDDSYRVKKGKLIDLKDLVNLKGNLCIEVGEFSTSYTPTVAEGACILKNSHLKALEINCDYCEGWSDQSNIHETLLEGLHPNHDLRKISMEGYQGTRLPKWASMMATSLPWLVSIKLSYLSELQHLPSLSKLCHLKFLDLENLPLVEHMESDAPSASVSRATKLTTFFPSLEKLILFKMPQLKGWWRGLRWMGGEAGGGGGLVNDSGVVGQDVILPWFPRLRELIIGHCKSMTYIPPCPYLKDLDLFVVNDALTFCMKGGLHPSPVTNTTASSIHCYPGDPSLCLEYLNIDNPSIFNSLFEDFVGGAVDIHIDHFFEMESMETVSEGFQKCEYSIQHLTLDSCKELTTLSGSGIEHLFNLQSLTIKSCNNLDLKYVDSRCALNTTLYNLSSLILDGLNKLETLPWRFMHLSSLESLEINSCYNLEVLGECIGFITTLRSLQIEWCFNLKALPECLKSLIGLKLLRIDRCYSLKSLPDAMRHLTSLATLEIISACDDLKKRCQQPDGEDWPKIRHIPDVYVSGC